MNANTDTTNRIIAAIGLGHTTQKQLMAELDLPKTTLINHLAKLIDAGDVIRTQHYATPGGSKRTAYSLPQPPAAPAQRAPRVRQDDIILGFLKAHADQQFTPHAISKATGHKGLRDACARLARQGLIAKADSKTAKYVFLSVTHGPATITR